MDINRVLHTPSPLLPSRPMFHLPENFAQVITGRRIRFIKEKNSWG